MTKRTTLKGVNLGGWLVLDRWMTPSLFKGTDAVDEFTFCDTANPKRIKELKKFRSEFITEEDFEWLWGQGIEAVRIPVGYWIFGDQPPYVGAVDFLDKAFIWGRKYKIKILICLHGAPGSQNGKDHSGCSGKVCWGDEKSVKTTLDVMRRLVERYKDERALLGFELLNEPSKELSKRLLKDYYKPAYKEIRQQCGPDTWVVFSDCFQLRRWAWSLHWPRYRQAYLDTHQYQVFTPQDKALDVVGHLAKTESVGRKLRRLGWHRRFIVGEWSAALDAQSTPGLDESGRRQASRSFMAAQIAAYACADAWFFWSYKTEEGGPWSYRSMMQCGDEADVGHL